MVLGYTFNITQYACTTKYITKGINKMFQLLRIMRDKILSMVSCRSRYRLTIRKLEINSNAGMCRVFGVIANKEVDIEFSFFKAKRPFKSLVQSNPDGWGIGYYEGGVPKVFKEGIEDAGRIENYQFEKVKTVRSKIIISHVRRATKGRKTSMNAHPFEYGGWIFAHNGGVDEECIMGYLKEIYRNARTSETDSEVYFLLIMQSIQERQNILDGIKEAIKIVKSCGSYTGLNFIMSDGESLYAYRDASRQFDHYSLYYLKRTPDRGQPFTYVSEKTGQLLHSKNLLGEEAVLVCSERLTEEDWQEIGIGSLVVINPDLGVEIKTL